MTLLRDCLINGTTRHRIAAVLVIAMWGLIALGAGCLTILVIEANGEWAALGAGRLVAALVCAAVGQLVMGGERAS